MYLYELRNLWQLFFHVTVGAFVTLQIWLRQAQGKAPDYDVWPHPSDILPWLPGKKEGAYLNCHCDEETVHHNREALLSLSPTLLFVLSQPGVPGSMQYVLGKLLMLAIRLLPRGGGDFSLQGRDSARTVRSYWKTWPAVLNPSEEFNQKMCVVHALRTKRELYSLGSPLWGMSIAQIKRCRGVYV